MSLVSHSLQGVMRQAAILGLVLALLFGRDALNAVLERSSSAQAPLDVDAGRSANLGVHIAFCTS